MINKKINEKILSIKKKFCFEINTIFLKIKRQFNIITYYHEKYESIVYEIRTFSFFKFIWSCFF
jgi:hypothetical protein